MKWIAGALAFVFVVIPMTAFFVGFMVQAWAPFWIGQRGPMPPSVVTGGQGPDVIDIGTLPLAPVLGPRPIVSDHERYQLALAAGFSLEEAITATAISIAENGGGNPAALSPRNRNGTFDLGLWQINSIHWPKYGGEQALVDPLNNARAAHGIYVGSGWCAWSTYDARCGVGHNGAYANYLSRARSAALP